MSKHTAEPWRYYLQGDSTAYIIASGTRIITRVARHYGDEEAHVARIVQCVNALAGMDPDAVNRVVNAAKTVLKNGPWQPSYNELLDAITELETYREKQLTPAPTPPSAPADAADTE